MSGKHLRKYLQKYQNYIAEAMILALFACSTTRKVPEGSYLLTKNTFKYEDTKFFDDELPDYVLQKPNKKQLLFLPVGLWLYNFANPKYDSILTEYNTYPADAKNQQLRDSLFVKYGHPEYVGKSLLFNRFLHYLGEPPVILEHERTEASATSIRKRLVYRGFWDVQVNSFEKLDSVAKKAQVTYQIFQKDPTMIRDFYYNIPDAGIRRIYEENAANSLVKSGERLDQVDLENEIKRINTLMRAEGYYKFNAANDEIYYTADTLKSSKSVPLTLDIHKDSADTPYKVATIGNIDLAIVDSPKDFPANTVKDSLRGINFHKVDDRYKTSAMWRAIISKTGDRYNQSELDRTKRNLLAMNNFTILKSRDSLRRGGTEALNDSIIDVVYILKPLPKYNTKIGIDLNYSQFLNLGVTPSVDLTTRNVFGGAENLTTSGTVTVGSVRDPKNPDKRVLAYEFSLQNNLSFPRLLLPFATWKLIPKRYSPTTSITLGASAQQNIGLGRINFNTGLNYSASVNDIVTHRLSIFNVQLSLTRNKDQYFEYFPAEELVKDAVFANYFVTHPDLGNSYTNGDITVDDVSNQLLADVNYIASLNAEGQNNLTLFQQSLLNRQRMTQDVIISSFIYNFSYNEIGKNDYKNPFFFNGKLEVAGNALNLFDKVNPETTAVGSDQHTIFKIPYSQFVKFDVDVRKYFQFPRNQTLVLRQVIGIGVPYGNSSSMPFIRSYTNGGSSDIRAWRPFGGLGPADSQADERIRLYTTGNMKLTTNIEYRVPFTNMYEGAIFVDAGNIWSLRNTGFSDQFRFSKFLSQMGLGSGIGLRVNVAYLTLRLDLAYKLYDPNQPSEERWRFSRFQPFKPTLNLAFGYPF